MNNSVVQMVFRRMTATQIMSAVTVTICLLVDSLVIGRYLGVDAMSAYGLANPLIIIFNALGTMTSCGVQVYLGKAMGKGDAEDCRRCFSTSLVMSIAISAIWMLFIFAATGPICVMLGAGSPGAGNQVAAMTDDYLRGYILGAPFFFMSQIMVPYLQSMGKRKLTVASVAAMTAADIIFDLLCVYALDAGMFGIGLSSGISYFVATLVGIGFFMNKDCTFKFEKDLVSAKTMKEIAYGGNPVLVNQAFFMIRVYALNRILLAVTGTVAVAAISVISTIGSIIFSIGLGAGSIALMLASIFYSEEDRSSLYDLINVMSLYSLKLIVIVVLFVQIAAPSIIDLFFDGSAEVTAIAITGLRLYSISLIACVLTTVYKNYYQGIRIMKLTNVLSFVNNVGILIPAVWVFSKMFGLLGVWIGIIVSEFATLAFICVVVWIKFGKVSFTTEAFSMLGPDFGASKKDVLELTITDMDTALAAPQTIGEFCTKKGLGDRLSMLLSLCVEEIIVNTVKYGFTDDKQKHSAEIRLVVHDEKCIVRIRDNCIGFDPTKYFELHESDSPTSHIGIRMVMKMVNEIDYINSLGLNNLYMSINR